MSKLDDLMGREFGRLTVTGRAPNDAKFRTYWICQCRCGSKPFAVCASALKRGMTKTCGCGKYEPRQTPGYLKHGMTFSSTYASWQAMKARCTNPKNASYRHYGGRGITFCDQWKTFENFLADMGERPPRTTLDRKDNDANYGPGNCRWATAQEQRANRRR